MKDLSDKLKKADRLVACIRRQKIVGDMHDHWLASQMKQEITLEEYFEHAKVCWSESKTLRAEVDKILSEWEENI